MRFPLFVIWAVWLLLLSLLQQGSAGKDRQQQCTLDWKHVVELAFDAESSSLSEQTDYRVVQVIDVFPAMGKSDNRNNGRYLRSSQEQRKEIASWVSIAETEDAIFARRCLCSSESDVIPTQTADDGDEVVAGKTTTTTSYYCPLSASTCALKTSSGDNNHNNVECFSDTTNKVTAVFWSTVLSVAGLAALLLCTGLGRHVLGRCISFVWTGFNDRVATYMLQRNPERAQAMIMSSQHNTSTGRRSPTRPSTTTTNNSHEDRKEPKRLLLRTQIYVPKNETTDSMLCENSSQNSASANDGESNDDNDNATCHDECSICFAILQAGDRVGNLACRHQFHAACLVRWAQRRNACPLCQQTVAEEESSSSVSTNKTLRRSGTMSTTNESFIREDVEDEEEDQELEC